MGKALFETVPEFRTHFLECAQLLDQELGFDFRAFMFNPENKEALENTRYTSPPSLSWACALEKFCSVGVNRELMIGH